jgi:RNA polymerase sigma-70 factor (sigma-E family)
MMAPVALDDAVADRDPAEEVADLFRSEYRSLVRLAALLLGDRAAAEEVVQDAFVNLQLGWRRLRERERAPAWLRSAVLNGARSRLRRRDVRRRHLGVVPRDVESAEAGAVAGDEHRRMIAALRTLPARQREALVLKFYLELSEAETAVAMGVSPGSVKTHVHRGLAALALVLEEDR